MKNMISLKIILRPWRQPTRLHAQHIKDNNLEVNTEVAMVDGEIDEDDTKVR